MLFSSIEFAVFLPIVFLLYWFVFNSELRLQNLFIVFASYLFYGWWDWRFLFLILFSTLVDYTIGVSLSKTATTAKRKTLLWVSLLVNLGLLGVFKYYNFFLDSLYAAVPSLQVELGFNALDIILPVGISFYTFQTLSYTIDVYRRKLEPTKDLISFAAFVSFFPQLVAGPIERATNLLPQFHASRSFDYARAVDGCRQILWGMFMKVVIADNCASYANEVFNNSSTMNSSALVLGALFFTFQIYGDFAGYSNIAIGTARLFGFDLKRNFAYPYFSRDIAEFWRRWHISLSTWFRDYLYIPLGGSRGDTSMRVRNTFIIFIVSGFWHGANWTFIVWGALNAIYFLPLLLTNNNRKNLGPIAEDRFLPSLSEARSMLLTFGLMVFAWIFFRAEDVGHALRYIRGIFTESILEIPDLVNLKAAALTLCFVGVFMVIEWLGRNDEYAIETLGKGWSRTIRWSAYYAIILTIFWYSGDEQEFIYFQF